MGKLRWPVLTALLFGIVYACSLTFVYVEGDDGASIAYHVMGRNRQLQGPYAPYHGMLDRLLGPLPADEPTLRLAAISLTAIATLGMVLLMLRLAFEVLDVSDGRIRNTAAIALPLAAPEFLFLGLVYTPASLGMCGVLGAHLLLVRSVGPRGVPALGALATQRLWLGSVLLFGFGAACRWDLVLYAAVVAAHLLLGVRTSSAESRAPLAARAAHALGWGALAFVSWLAAVTFSGYSPPEILEFLSDARAAQGLKVGLSLATLASLSSLLTPLFLLSTVVGWVALLRRQPQWSVITVLALIPALPWIPLGAPKAFLFSIPPLVACFVEGLRTLLTAVQGSAASAVRAAIVVLAIAPWLLGVRATFGDTAWGPGFEMRAYDRPEVRGLKVRPTLGAGAATPTQEGARSLWGYGAVLLGGGWRGFESSRSLEYEAALRHAIDRRTPFFIMQGALDGRATNVLARWKFSTSDPSDRSGRKPFTSRRFTNAAGDELVMLRTDMTTEALVNDTEAIRGLRELAGGSQVVVYGHTPSNLRDIFKRTPEALSKIGPNSAVLDLSVL